MSMARKVYIREASYDYRRLKPVVFEMMDACGAHIPRGGLVLLKPNFLSPAPPEKAMLTHPLVVRAVSEYVLEKGGRPQISDSPAVGAFEKILKEGGFREALSGLDVRFSEFRESVPVAAPSMPYGIRPPFPKLELAKDALDAELIINLPKLKTHAQMLLTLGIKNLFGCVVGLRKPEWHFRAGVDRQMFASLLVQVWAALRPAVTLLDGVLALEGDGPGKGGVPRRLGLLFASSSAPALDIAVCRTLGIEPGRVPTNEAAGKMGFHAEEIEIDGAKQKYPVENFVLPGQAMDVIFGPKRFHGAMRAHLLQRPVVNEDLCKLCGECLSYCPAGAIEKKDAEGKKESRLAFDYEKCIRCYCCLEVCPQGAIRAREPMAGKLVGKTIKAVHDLLD
ncbi:MAG: DUF362 domain-containing protein [Nitrospiraceae bacterium]|nr:DUF362 domain-containing protein [Nitrospiraceae bacterium]